MDGFRSNAFLMDSRSEDSLALGNNNNNNKCPFSSPEALLMHEANIRVC